MKEKKQTRVYLIISAVRLADGSTDKKDVETGIFTCQEPSDSILLKPAK